MRIFAVLTLAVGAAACAPPPPPVVTPTPPAPAPPTLTLTYEQKQSIILRLEDRRVLRDPTATNAAQQITADPAAAARMAEAFQSLPPRSLLDFVTDEDARIRRRSVLAVGRTGVADAVPSLIPRLTDAEPEVRQMAAFALGLLRDERAREPLETALRDAAPVVQGSAAQALGLLGDTTAAEAIAALAKRILETGALRQLPDDRDDRRDTPADVFRLALAALVQLKSFPALASVVLDQSGQPRLTWWPVAFALGRLEDPRAANALLTLAADPHPYTRAFAIKGLGALKEARAVDMLVPLIGGPDRFIAIEAMRALGRIGSPKAGEALIKIIESGAIDLSRRTEAIAALGGVGGSGVPDLFLDLLGDRNPVVRAAAIQGYTRMDPEGFITILSALDADPHWSVRAALATALGDMPGGVGLPRLKLMVQDSDQRVVPAVIAALAKINGPGVGALLFDRLKADDPTVRAAAAQAIGQLKLAGGPAALRDAYQVGLNRDVAYVARGAALAAIATYGATEAVPLLTDALTDREWPVRARAASLLRSLSATSDADARIRPAPVAHVVERYDLPRLVTPAVSPMAYLDTDKGTIQIELAVLDAPLTVENFVTLAKSGFYDGVSFHRVVPNFVVQTGDPRGDGDGGPGYTIRDELNERSYMRGTVGMALDWADTGGSQFFITHSPQPHLDARYTIFGRVIDGMNVVDLIEQGDVLRKVRIVDGESR